MMISPYCGFFKEERDDEYAPPYDMCELCYRYDICKKAEIQEALVTGVEDDWIKEDRQAWEEYLKAKGINNKGDNYE